MKKKMETNCHNYFGPFLLHLSIYFMVRSKFNLLFLFYNKHNLMKYQINIKCGIYGRNYMGWESTGTTFTMKVGSCQFHKMQPHPVDS